MRLLYQLARLILRNDFNGAKALLKLSDNRANKDVAQAQHEIDNPPSVPIDWEAQGRLEKYMKPINDEIFEEMSVRQSSPSKIYR